MVMKFNSVAAQTKSCLIQEKLEFLDFPQSQTEQKSSSNL